MRLFFVSSFLLALIAYAVGAVGFSLLWYGVSYQAFGVLYRMPLYQYEHPFQYLAVVAIPYGLLGGLWLTLSRQSSGLPYWLGLGAVIAGTVIIGSVMGGLLWTYHDMLAGFFPSRDARIANFWKGAWMGLYVGPLLVVLSLPLNLASLWVGLIAPRYVRKWLRPTEGAGVREKGNS